MKTPVAFFIFNRPDTTELVFEAIRRAAPSRLLIVADGPRLGRLGEAEKCAAAREIVSRVDWPCEVSVDYAERNLGCRRRVSSGLDWVFRTVEEAIILEDDCLPDQSFFRFCQELLEKHRSDDRIMMISGDNFQKGVGTISDSYHFSRYPHIWGWASWRRAWKLYDVEMQQWQRFRGEGMLEGLFQEKETQRFWREVFDSVHRGEIDTWDHQFTFACLRHQALCVVPAVNLVSNLGFREDATHTRERNNMAELRTVPMRFPLRHPHDVVRNVEADLLTEKEHRLPSGPVAGLRRMLGRIVRKVRG